MPSPAVLPEAQGNVAQRGMSEAALDGSMALSQVASRPSTISSSSPALHRGPGRGSRMRVVATAVESLGNCVNSRIVRRIVRRRRWARQ